MKPQYLILQFRNEKHKKEYSKGEVTIVWQSGLCIHSGNCVRGLLLVFNSSAHPWIIPGGATTEEIISQVKKCPSGALNYYQNNSLTASETNTAAVKNPIVNNTMNSRFEMEINGDFAFVEYRFYKDDIALMHTFVPEPERNKGFAAALAKFSLEYVKDQKLKLLLYCPTIAKYIKLHPEYEILVDKQYR